MRVYLRCGTVGQASNGYGRGLGTMARWALNAAALVRLLARLGSAYIFLFVLFSLVNGK